MTSRRSRDTIREVTHNPFIREVFPVAKLDQFTRAYIAAALWATVDDNDEPLDVNYSAEDLAEETLVRIASDCERFQHDNGDLIVSENCNYQTYSAEVYAGYDFFLTRNGHGCGYWDGDWEKTVGERLTEAARKFGEFNLYVGDDGKLYAWNM